MKCINFGGCYGYDLTEIFNEFIRYCCIFTVYNTSSLTLQRFTYEYISFLQKNYDLSIEYQEYENKKLIKYLIRYYNKQRHPHSIVLMDDRLINVWLK